MNKFSVVLIAIILFLPTQVEGQIYICVDKNGFHHYSDKKCPTDKKLKEEIMNDYGKKVLPDYILEYRPIIQSVKRVLALLIQYQPDSELYQKAYTNTEEIEKLHNKFLDTHQKTAPTKYDPFITKKADSIVAAISRGCRFEAHMTVCGMIESNQWLFDKEQTYIKARFENELFYEITESDRKLYCEKAERANQGGVVSRNMMEYFCTKS